MLHLGGIVIFCWSCLLGRPFQRTEASRYLFAVFRALALWVRALAAALEAFVAIARRSVAVRAFARACPPRLPISFRNFRIGESSMRGSYIILAAKVMYLGA